MRVRGQDCRVYFWQGQSQLSEYGSSPPMIERVKSRLSQCGSMRWSGNRAAPLSGRTRARCEPRGEERRQKIVVSSPCPMHAREAGGGGGWIFIWVCVGPVSRRFTAWRDNVSGRTGHGLDNDEGKTNRGCFFPARSLGLHVDL